MKLYLLEDFKLLGEPKYFSFTQNFERNRISSIFPNILTACQLIEEVDFNIKFSTVISYERFWKENTWKKCHKNTNSIPFRKLEFIVEEDLVYSTNSISNFSSIVQNFEYLEEMSLRFVDIKKISFQNHKILSSKICGFTRLAKFWVNFGSSKEINKEVLQIWHRAILKLPNLYELLFLGRSKNIFLEQMKIIRKIQSLKKFEFLSEHYNYDITANEFIIMINSIMKQKSLKYLKIYWNIILEDKQVAQIVSIIKNFGPISYLNMDLSCLRVSDEGLARIFEALGHLKYLYSFNIETPCKQFSPLLVEKLSQSIKKLELLREFVLKIGIEYCFTDENLLNIIQSIPKCVNSINIDCRQTAVRDKGSSKLLLYLSEFSMIQHFKIYT